MRGVATLRPTLSFEARHVGRHVSRCVATAWRRRRRGDSRQPEAVQRRDASWEKVGPGGTYLTRTKGRAGQPLRTCRTVSSHTALAASALIRHLKGAPQSGRTSWTLAGHSLDDTDDTLHDTLHGLSLLDAARCTDATSHYARDRPFPLPQQINQSEAGESLGTQLAA